MDWIVPRIWENSDVWIIGGGTSIIKQFNVPQEIVNKVLLKQAPLSEYSPYMEAIHEKHVIGINVAYMLGNWVDMVFFGDNSFFLPHQERLKLFPNLKVSSCIASTKYNWVRHLEHDKIMSGISTNPRTVAWNHNSGIAAISVAYNAGAKRIFLLGFDMNYGENYAKHFHSEYKANPILSYKMPDPKKFPFRKHLQHIPKVALDAKKLGLMIYNVNPDSAIKEFPKISLQEALKL